MASYLDVEGEHALRSSSIASRLLCTLCGHEPGIVAACEMLCSDMCCPSMAPMSLQSQSTLLAQHLSVWELCVCPTRAC